jgi:hypothetical protein
MKDIPDDWEKHIPTDAEWDEIMTQVMLMKPADRERFYRIAEADGMSRQRLDEIAAVWLAERKVQ